ncbi:MAG: hypothetical protein KGH98_01940 [Candidatus Micrarchaeota archaeon]|nr:hypothetical protein [Candidatus Micrarchaeota archaeon]
MPIRYNLTKYDTLATRIHKLAVKNNGRASLPPNNGSGNDGDDRHVVNIAILIASFSSSHSWQTSKIITDPISDMKNPDVRQEYVTAASGGWKSISAHDINEVYNRNIPEPAFKRWLFSHVDKQLHDGYTSAWSSFKSMLEGDCDDVETISATSKR